MTTALMTATDRPALIGAHDTLDAWVGGKITALAYADALNHADARLNEAPVTPLPHTKEGV